MNKEREKVYQILELGKDEKNLHHKKGLGGLLFIDLSMLKFSKLSSYIRQLEKENQALKEKFKATNKGLQKVVLKRKKWKHRYQLARCEIKELKEKLDKYEKVGTLTSELLYEENTKV